MKTRHVFSTDGMDMVKRGMKIARESGIAFDDISLIARDDIELEAIPDQRKVVDNDFYPAAVRGVVGGGAAGLLAGVVAVSIAPIGLTLAGVGAMTLIGASMGAWASALAGSSVPDPVRRKFEDEIAQGRILLVLDGSGEALARAAPRLAEIGARQLPFDTPAVLS
ncbi:hypothetical protein FHW84_003236 [Dyella sp. SG562]|jgi:hypothetical protein|uniref:hypothetical protein n=1 Tax=Dyella TaxID=231454 RepID=UPI001421D6B3|nr:MULTISPECIES: hypothetical protein [unclassified Dyella]NII74646.1 hypothetical protein [Dyella sp. SG562]NKJ20173.1 hypothetical protein [Dyella sp. SG609]